MNLDKTISEIMSTDLMTINETDSIIEYEDFFKRRHVHHILVVNQSGDLSGIISTEDVSKNKCFAIDDKILAKHIMTENVKCFLQDDKIETVLKAFLEDHIRAYPIKDEQDKLVGIVTPYDVLRSLYLESN